ncbi:tripartite tricarboxylate transporter TctB family protein [Psychrobacillus sp. NPDC096389]|uniref:tripartite tricarboxylate transporter TctB family protein n=1 Tax=Psychrobacillus sp. NPDC096389 TaxID=3364490 RepID=UPI0038005CB7
MTRKVDRYVSIVLIIIGIFIVYESSKISSMALGSSVGPRTFPLGLGVLIILLSLRLLYESFKKEYVDIDNSSWNFKKFFLFLALLIIYIVVFEKIGFVVSTFIFLFVAFQIMKKGKIIYSFLISFAFSFGIYYMYVEVLRGTLPGFPEWLGL